MLLIDEGDWPLLLLRWEQPVGEMDLGLYRVRFEGWLTRGKPFAILSFQPPEPGPASLRPLIHGAFWSSDLRKHTTRHCAGIARVTSGGHPDGIERENSRLQRLLGCRVGSFHDGDEALRWLRARLKDFTPLAEVTGGKSETAERLPLL